MGEAGNLIGRALDHEEGVEQVHSIFYILQQYSTLTSQGRGEGLLRLLLGVDCCGREQEALYYYSEIQVVYIVII